MRRVMGAALGVVLLVSAACGSGPDARAGVSRGPELARRATSAGERAAGPGSIRGRVADEDGEPLARVSVELVRWGYAQGQRVLRSVTWGSGVTDDLGRYRLYGLPSGEYFLRASPAAAAVEDEGGIRIVYVPIYYPGTADIGAATLVTLAEGDRTELSPPLLRIDLR